MWLLRAMRSPVWPGILVALAVVGLLLAFHHVVRGAVQQGESRRIAAVVPAEAVWRCKAVRGLRVHDDCAVEGRNVVTDASVTR